VAAVRVKSETHSSAEIDVFRADAAVGHVYRHSLTGHYAAARSRLDHETPVIPSAASILFDRFRETPTLFSQIAGDCSGGR